ncbi:MAG TPA: peptidylprolyl isomerase [Gammaproteobacteria bacterium]|nr:peptidylprolyl isomerase [Gammaproteobacteria bacterium]
MLSLVLAGCALTSCAGSPPAPARAAQARQDKAVDNTAPAPGALLDRIVAVVNSDVILASELDLRVAVVQKQVLARNTPLPPVDVLRKQVLDQMVLNRIELQQADQHGITVSDDAVNQAMSRIASSQGLTLDQLPDRLKTEGVSYSDFREDLREQIIVRNMEQQVVNDQMHITPQEVEEEARADLNGGSSDAQYHLAHILIATPLNPTPDEVAAAQKKANDIYQKLKGGADFAATAVASSDDQQALKGGDLGWRKGSELPTVFASVVRQMKVGDVSEPIPSAIGFHIVKLVELKQTDKKYVVSQTHARHILIRPGELMTGDQAKAKISVLRQQIVAGADFAKLAESNSADPGSARQGGDLGWVDPGTMVPEFEDAMNKLQPGEISEPFQTQFGWHIVQVLGRRDADQTDEYRRNKAYEAIFNRKSDEIIQQWVSEAKDAAYIEYHLDG